MKMTKVLKLSFNGAQISRNLVWENPGELSTRPENAGAIELQQGDDFCVELIMSFANEYVDVDFTVGEAKLYTVLSEASGSNQTLSPFEAAGEESPWTALPFSSPMEAVDGFYVLRSDAVTVKAPASKSLRWELSLVLVARIQGGVPPFNKVLRFDPEVVVTQR
ncbi:MAG: hypothetical protein O9341_21450 [Paucibacter sp.]|nr:hypothetical protein [Roseateles sp.]